MSYLIFGVIPCVLPNFIFGAYLCLSSESDMFHRWSQRVDMMQTICPLSMWVATSMKIVYCPCLSHNRDGGRSAQRPTSRIFLQA